MKIRLHPHAQDRLNERGAFEHEAKKTVQTGEMFPAKFGRVGFRKNFPFNKAWRGKVYRNKQVEVYAVKEKGEWLIIIESLQNGFKGIKISG